MRAKVARCPSLLASPRSSPDMGYSSSDAPIFVCSSLVRERERLCLAHAAPAAARRAEIDAGVAGARSRRRAAFGRVGSVARRDDAALRPVGRGAAVGRGALHAAGRGRDDARARPHPLADDPARVQRGEGRCFADGREPGRGPRGGIRAVVGLARRVPPGAGRRRVRPPRHRRARGGHAGGGARDDGCCRGRQGMARNVLHAQCVAHGAVRSAREPEVSARGGGGLKGPQRRGALARLWLRVRVGGERMPRKVLRVKRGAQVLRAQCAAHGAVRSAREPEASARRWRAGEPSASRRVGAFAVARACGW